MRFPRLFLTVGMLSVLAACQRDATPRIDDALRQDLSLAASAQPYAPQQFVSPVEQGYGYAPQGYYPSPRYAPTPVVYRSAPRVIRRAPAPVVNEGSAGDYGTEEVVVKKNAKRDAIIGAAAGAAIGAATTRNRVKGAVIGAAAGGILGAIIGEKIDVTKTRIPR